MSNNPKTAVASRNLGLDAAFDVLNSGKLRIYSGTQPTDADTALSSNTVLADLALSATAFAAASAGSKAANAISDDSDADATGTASFGSLLTSGNVRKLDFTVATSGGDMTINTVSIVQHATVSVSSFTISQAA